MSMKSTDCELEHVLVWHPDVLLLHCRVRQLLPVDDQVSVVRGFQGEPPVTDPTAVAPFLVLLHDVLQVFFPLRK